MANTKLPILDTMIKANSNTRDKLAKYKYNHGLPRLNEAIEHLLDNYEANHGNENEAQQLKPVARSN